MSNLYHILVLPEHFLAAVVLNFAAARLLREKKVTILACIKLVAAILGVAFLLAIVFLFKLPVFFEVVAALAYLSVVGWLTKLILKVPWAKAIAITSLQIAANLTLAAILGQKILKF